MNDAKRILGEGELASRLAADLPQWQYHDGHLTRRYATSGWKASLMAANAVGHLAELAWHHPELRVEYPALTVRLKSHDVNGITERDFALARRIEDLLCWRPGRESGSALEGTPADPRYVYLKD
jgi:4a-hydroxytetrahydrobiopterin dehydratase